MDVLTSVALFFIRLIAAPIYLVIAFLWLIPVTIVLGIAWIATGAASVSFGWPEWR